MILAKLKKELLNVSDEYRREMNQKFFKTGPGEYAEGDIFVGLSMPDIRKIIKSYFQIINVIIIKQ